MLWADGRVEGGCAGLVLSCLLMCQLGVAQGNVCPPGCLCASDILSCAALGLEEVPGEMPFSTVTLDLGHNHLAQLNHSSFGGLPRLEVLRLSHNRLAGIEPGAFHNSSAGRLRHLDLSSNQLRVLEQHYFEELTGLEELLLFNNSLVRVESRALAALGSLRKAYLSHNLLTDFPFFTVHQGSHPHLATLDLSSNRLPKLPLEDIVSLPPVLQRGLYLHNNSFICECSMYRLLRRWELRGYSTVEDYRKEHTCLVFGLRKGTVRFFQHGGYFESCNQTAMKQLIQQEEQESAVLVNVGETVLLDCITTLTGHLNFLWVSPNQEYVAPPGNNGSLRMYANGSLEIMAAKVEDTGMYWCLALDRQRQRNETREVNVTVAVPGGTEHHESFNTGFTTLLGCMVSLMLVLMYLYLTPCRCPPCRQRPTPPTATPSPGNEAGPGSAQSSILSPTPPATTEGPGRKVSSNKHVVFLEPIREQQNGRLRAGLGSGVGHGHLGPGLLLDHPSKVPSQSQQRAGETDSIMSVFSDTTIMVP